MKAYGRTHKSAGQEVLEAEEQLLRYSSKNNKGLPTGGCHLASENGASSALKQPLALGHLEDVQHAGSCAGVDVELQAWATAQRCCSER